MENLKSLLASNMPSMRDWYVVAGDTQSTLYYGFYKAVDPQVDKREGERTRRDKQAITSLSNNATQERLFQYCAFMALEQKDPGGPPEWNLENAKGYWSLEIAAFTGTPDRKEAAVEAVKMARKEGIEAYYYHGDTISSVLVGAWPEAAVKRQESDVAKTDTGEATDRRLLIMDGGVQLSEQRRRQLDNVRDEEGNPLKVVQPKIDLTDPTMLAAMKAYPAHDVNNRHREGKQVDSFGRPMKDAQGHDIMAPVDRSFLVVIPHKNNSYAAQPVPYQVPPIDSTMLNAGGGTPQGGKLRTIGGN